MAGSKDEKDEADHIMARLVRMPPKPHKDEPKRRAQKAETPAPKRGAEKAKR